MIVDFLIDVVNFLLNNTILKVLPVEIPGLSLGQFEVYLTGITNTIASGINFFDNFFDFGLLMFVLSFVIVAEIMLHFGFKSMKYVINLFRGSGG